MPVYTRLFIREWLGAPRVPCTEGRVEPCPFCPVYFGSKLCNYQENKALLVVHLNEMDISMAEVFAALGEGILCCSMQLLTLG
jgi:hypothetical protein